MVHDQQARLRSVSSLATSNRRSFGSWSCTATCNQELRSSTRNSTGARAWGTAQLMSSLASSAARSASLWSSSVIHLAHERAALAGRGRYRLQPQLAPVATAAERRRLPAPGPTLGYSAAGASPHGA